MAHGRQHIQPRKAVRQRMHQQEMQLGGSREEATQLGGCVTGCPSAADAPWAWWVRWVQSGKGRGTGVCVKNPQDQSATPRVRVTQVGGKLAVSTGDPVMASTWVRGCSGILVSQPTVFVQEAHSVTV